MSTNFVHLANFLTSGRNDIKAYCLQRLKEGKGTTLETFWKERELRRILDANPDIKIFLDSGAHSLLNAQVGLINQGAGIESEKGDKQTLTPGEAEERLTVNQRIRLDGSTGGAIQTLADFSFNDRQDVRDYLDRYIAFIKEYDAKGQLMGYVNLDIIYSAEESWKNQQYMESHGLRPIPVFHFGEDFKWWQKYVQEYDYIGIGGVAGGVTMEQFVRSLGDPAFKYLWETDPTTKVHGFAVTSNKLIVRYPFQSVDSVSGDSMLLIRDCGRIRVETIEDLYKISSGLTEKCERGTYRHLRDVEVFVPNNKGQGFWTPATKVIRHEVGKHLHEVKTKTGRKLKLTNDHGLFVYENGKYVCKPTPSVEVGEHCVGVNFKGVQNGLLDIVVEVDRKISTGYGKYQMRKVPVRVVLDRDLLTFFGLWLADGSYVGKTSVSVSTGNSTECIALCRRIAKRYGRKLTEHPSGDVDISSADLVRSMQALNLIGYSHTKEIPWWVFDLSVSRIGMFLNGYFSGDGTCCRDIECSTVSRKLLWGVFYLLQAVGIDSRIYESRRKKKIPSGQVGLGESRPCHSLSIGDVQSLQRFQEMVGFLQDRKNQKLSESVASCSEHRGIRSKRENQCVYVKVQENIDLGVYRGLVYDLEVPCGQRFVANGLLVHNSTTWLKHAAYGNVMVPRWDPVRKRFDYISPPVILSVSDISLVKESKQPHYTLSQPPDVIERIHEYFAEGGIDPEKLKTDMLERFRVDIFYYQKLLEQPEIHERKPFTCTRSFF